MSASRADEPYQVVARRFRPKSFGEVVGQDAILSALKTAIASGRIPHAFLFSGSRGVGKTTSARILARALNCKKGPTPEPCGKCEACVAILAGSFADVVEIDAASHNMVDDIRELRDRVGFASMGARYKVYILDEAHMLTRSAFNALLKTLEEPPPNVVFVLATTELHKVPETIRSRCQVMLFKRVSDEDICDRLRMICAREEVVIADEVLAEIAAESKGGMRDAETALERVLPVARESSEPFGVAAFRELQGRVGSERTMDVVEALARGEAAPALHFAEAVVGAGVDEREALGEVLDLLRAVLLLKIDGKDSTLVTYSGSLRERLVAVSLGCDAPRLDAMIQAGLLGRERIRRLEDRRLVLELSLLRMAQAGSVPLLGELAAALRSGDLASAPEPVAAAPARPTGPVATSGTPGAFGAGLKPKLLHKLQQVRPLFAGTIELCDVVGPDPTGRVTLRLKSDKKLHQDRLASEPLRKELELMLREIAGRDVNLVVETGSCAPAVLEAPAPHKGPRPDPGPAVLRVRQMFDATFLPEDERKAP